MTKVLIIDDDVLVTNMIKETLDPDSFEVFVANSGSEGIETTRQLKPDVIVLDLMMPGMSGWEVCRTIRTFSQVPILVLSAVIDSERVTRALDDGADDYLVKPVPTGMLASRIKRLMKNAHAKQG